jgi:dTDP-4-dehydrorhamnose reductase
VLAPSHSELDITNEHDVQRTVAEFTPDLVINCASTGDVDRCEREPDWAYSVNELGPRMLARACTRSGAEMFHTSTDYVFDGAKEGYYSQEDVPRPQSVYGKSKLSGEIAVGQEAARFYIIRTSWLFGVGGKNRQPVVWYAQPGSKALPIRLQPRTRSCARIEEIIALRAFGLLSGTNSGVATWFNSHGSGSCGNGEVEISLAVKTEQLAPRPVTPRCGVCCPKLGLAPLRHWREAVVDLFAKSN